MYGREVQITRTTVSPAAAVLALAAALALAAVLAVAGLAAPAHAQGERASLAIPFKVTAPATQTGLDMDLRYFNPRDRNAKPPAITELAIHLPPGTRLDPTAVPVCRASDEEIQSRGRDACPPQTKVGTGTLDVYLGAPDDPQRTDLALHNGPGQLIEILLFEGSNTTAAFERLPIEGTTIRGKPAQVPPTGPPELRAAASRIVWDIPANGRYVVTPPSCPLDGLWRTTGEFKFADGGSTTVATAQACARVGGSPGGADRATRSVRVVAAPRTLVRGRRTPIRVRLVSQDPACVRGARVWVGRRSARTDARGRATVNALVRYRARPKVRAYTPCGRAYASLVARRR